jgi:hypothetical protein
MEKRGVYFLVAGTGAGVGEATPAFEPGFIPGVTGFAPGTGTAAPALTGSFLEFDEPVLMTLRLNSMIRDRVKMKLVKMKMKAQAEVVFVRKFPAPLLPKIVWLELPNPTPASPFPGCSKITTTRKTQIKPCNITSSVNSNLLAPRLQRVFYHIEESCRIQTCVPDQKAIHIGLTKNLGGVFGLNTSPV